MPTSASRAGRPGVRGVLAGLVLLSLCACSGEPEPTGKPPHVILLVLDTTRADRCGFNGYGRPTTPRLDALAHESVVFREAWAATNWTGPSHATMLTGLIPQHHGYLLGNRGYLDRGANTLTEILAAAGYDTGCFSNNPFVSPEFGIAQGFARFEPFYDRGPPDVSRAAQTHREAADWAEAVHRRGDRFFLLINDIEPHLAYTPLPHVQPRFVDFGADPALVAEARAFSHPLQMGYDLGLVEVSDEKLAILSDLYDAEIAGLDAAVGELVDRLRERGILDETLLIMVGDHGEALGEHHLIGHQYGLYRCLLHVPLLIRLPGRYDGGREVHDLVRLEDLMPTVLESCGIPIPGGLDGTTLSRDLSGRIGLAAMGRMQGIAKLRAEWPDADVRKVNSSLRSVFDGRYHLILSDSGREELYDLEQDPAETRNRAGDLPDVVARLKALAADA